MIWAKSLGLTEFIFIALFIGFYLIYILRVVRIAKRLHSTFSAIFIKVFLRTLVFGLLLVALLGPSFGENTREVKAIGKDIYFAIDLSASMNAFDIQPSRLEKVKYELKNIADAFSSDKMGLIIFSSEAFVQCPLTDDQSAFSLFVETLHTGLVPNAGTDFGPPLKSALNKLNEEEAAGNEQKSKVIILISDGEDFGDESKSVAKEIEQGGIKLFTLGVGTDKGSKIRTRTGFKKDKSRNDVVTKLDSRSLKELASITGGKYFEINESNNDVSRLINTIDQIEGELRESKKVDVAANKYFYFLALGIILMMVDILTSFKTLRI
ncbi:VWA domain-containing protein [Fulvivirgaceae bacterium BMA10]|uniref:VWA domain-containing protein n=1 Tax=Splendidivirga corallicola TaxID=3051826 RepID=A0ABT8KG71_9BACT|nr:VWA domain-containing protein [Fulvivirgaceae bacterium BMA10]